MPLGGGSKCGLCKKSVYMNEEVKYNSQSWHKLCFKCNSCKKLLELGAAVDHGLMIYCKNCHGKNFGTAGYGHGVGAGILSTDSGCGAPQTVAASQASASYASARQQTAQRAQGTVGAKVFGGSNRCPRCSKAVYHAEKVAALSKDWHKACFKCPDCNKSLEPGNFGDRDGEVYCKGCYGKRFGPKGVGYGIGAGVLST